MGSSPSSPTGASTGVPGRGPSFWQRISEGRQIDELWSQFTADARAGYGFYMKEANAEEMVNRKGRPRFFRIAKTLLWSLVMKLTPARRILAVVAFALFFVSGAKFQIGKDFVFDFDMSMLSAVLFLFLLGLELADKVTMKRDLEIAREIQSWLIPSSPPVVPGADIAFATRPQNSVAGDYYDAFFPTANAEKQGKLLLVIADVAGKSVPAALLMSTLQASLRTIAGEGASLQDLVLRLNRYASAHSLDGRRFTTAVIAEYEPETRVLTYVNAGHNPPIVRRANGSTETMEIGGLPLGIQGESTYETGEVTFSPGDALIFYTDGVIEAFNDKLEEYGNPRWLDSVRALPDWSAAESLQFLMRRVDAFVGTTRQSDDITCLVMRCK
jgi:phosphoserine phosphatase RsbU/P